MEKLERPGPTLKGGIGLPMTPKNARKEERSRTASTPVRNSHKISRSRLLLLAVGAAVWAFGCSPKPHPPTPRYQPLPPLQSTSKVPTLQEQQSAGPETPSRWVRRLEQNQYDVKIIHSGAENSGPFDRGDPEYGFSLLCSDLNGDGLQDLIVGAPYPEGQLGSGDSSGDVSVFFGRKNFPRTLDLARADLILSYPPTPLSPRFGQALAAGDFNGDGRNDLLLGAPHAAGAEGVFRAGEVYLVYGRKKMTGRVNILKSADVTLTSLEVGNETGFALAAGDLNGDGRQDLLIGSPGANRGNRVMVGRVEVIFGRTDLPRRLSLAASWDMRLTGIDGPNVYLANFLDAPDRAGSALAAGDLNHDGFDDLVIGAPYANGPLNERADAGEVYLVYGTKNPKRNVDLETEADVTFWGALRKNYAGFSLAAADLNADDHDDLVIGTGDPQNIKKKDWQVGAYLVYGRPALPPQLDLLKQSDRVFKDVRKKGRASLLEGKETIDYFLGYTLALGDLNRNGFPEILLGSPEYAGNRGQVAYGVSGRPLSSRVINLPDRFEGLILQKNHERTLSHAVALGDLNGDGWNDLVVRAPEGNETSRRRRGYIFILLGKGPS